MGKRLEITETKAANVYTTTGLASTVYEVCCTVDGVRETYEVKAQEEALVLIVDGVQKNLYPGMVYDVPEGYAIKKVQIRRVGGPSAAPWSGAKEEEKVTYYFRQALLVENGEIVPEASVPELIGGGDYDSRHADRVQISSDAPHFNGIVLEGATHYEITDSEFNACGDGSDDLSGWGAMIAAYDTSSVEISNSCLKTKGCCRPALYVGDSASAIVKNSVLYSQETADTYEEFHHLVPAMMKRVPFALGMEGAVRTLNIMGAGQGKFDDCIVVSTGWGALSTDSGTAYDNCGTYAIEAKDTLSGIGVLEVVQEGKHYTAVKTVNGVQYGFTVGGSGYVTYADSGVHNRYDHCEFYSPDYIQVFGSGRSGSFYTDCYLLAQHSAFMAQQSGGAVISLADTKVDVTDSLIQIKSGKANTGYANLIADHCEICFSGNSTRSTNGILCELVESDDAGNPGIMICTIDDHPEDAKATRSTLPDSTATFKDGSYCGDIYNSIYEYRQLLDVTAEHASLCGIISSSVANHVDFDGKRVSNGIQLHAYEGSKVYDIADYRADQGGSSGEYALIGRFSHTPSMTLNNPVNLTLKDSTWQITGDCYLNVLKVEREEELSAEMPVTLHVKSFIVKAKSAEDMDAKSAEDVKAKFVEEMRTETVGDAKSYDEEKIYEDGTYTLGNITLIVDSTEIEAEDTGIADAGQTYGNVSYKFMCTHEDGTPDSAAVAVKRQNYVDGNLYFTLKAADGYDIMSVTAHQGEIHENHAAGELEAYTSILMPEDGVKEMIVTVTVAKS